MVGICRQAIIITIIITIIIIATIALIIITTIMLGKPHDMVELGWRCNLLISHKPGMQLRKDIRVG